jgi:tellurium resistance protein TerD
MFFTESKRSERLLFSSWKVNTFEKVVLVGVNLSKGGVVDLAKSNPGLTKVNAGLGWDPVVVNGKDVDCDVSAFLLTANGKVGSDSDFVFYNNEWSADRSVQAAADDRTGGSSDGGDDETMQIDLSRVSSSIERIAVVCTINEATERGHNFGQVPNAYIRVVNQSTDVEVLRYDLTGDFSKNDAVVFGEFRRISGGWEFKAIGEGRTGGLLALCKEFGVNV